MLPGATEGVPDPPEVAPTRSTMRTTRPTTAATVRPAAAAMWSRAHPTMRRPVGSAMDRTVPTSRRRSRDRVHTRAVPAPVPVDDPADPRLEEYVGLTDAAL